MFQASLILNYDNPRFLPLCRQPFQLESHAKNNIHLVGTQNFPKTNIPYPLIHTRTCMY